MSPVSKKIAPGAYQALRDALPVVFWFKRPFESFVRTALRDSPELLAGLNFGEPKRIVADQLVGRLVANEGRYHEVTIQLMVEVGSMRRFPDLEKHENSKQLVAEAEKAVAELQRWTQRYQEVLAERDRLEVEARGIRAQQDALRKFGQDLEALKTRFLEMRQTGDAAGRGNDFQGFLRDLFALFDMEPRLAYSLEHEQIDGSLSFDTDDYILEARWRKEPTSRDHLDVFAQKVRRKGKNALGLYVSVNGFTSDGLETYKEETPFMTMDGRDLFLVLDQRVRLDDLLRRKKRHANETGDCNFPATRLVND
jgi:hypothetical protein